MGLRQVAQGFESRQFNCSEYVSALLLQSEKCTQLNAWTARDPAALLRSAAKIDLMRSSRDGHNVALSGIPIAIKDNINTNQLPTTGATRGLQGHTPPNNAQVVNQIFEAGGLLAGKTNMHELALGVTTNNPVTGACLNPWNLKMIPGGSSGGSAVAVAARMVPAALGTDTGASVRLPAALCGVVGFRPSLGRYSKAGIIPVSSTRDTVGPITRSVEDAALMDSVLTDSAVGLQPLPLRGLRIGIARMSFFNDADPQVLSAIEIALRSLSQLGVVFIEADIPDIERLNAAIGNQIALYEFMREMPVYLNESGYSLSLTDLIRQIESPDVLAILKSQVGVNAVTSSAYLIAMQSRKRLQSVYADYFLKHRLDATIFPTSVLPARPICEVETVELNGRQTPTFKAFIRNTSPSSAAAIPGISIPVGLTRGGLPIGMEIDASFGHDRRLLAIAASVEAVLAPMPAPKFDFFV